jgi:hypothetical protein
MQENTTRWRLILGEEAKPFCNIPLTTEQFLMDQTLDFIYNNNN